ncbi:MAG: hypothetical protein GX575_08830 [Candidatus Anammoximicrobium sp.]|nr:hypothetical protein [Candidatus Anammoximicrobium sp.]
MTVRGISWLCSLLLLAALAGCRSAPLAAGPHLDPLSLLPWAHRAEEVAWENWAARHLESGDLLFVRGDSRILFGLVNFSQLCTDLADSRFSHVGLASQESDGLFVYDVVVGGPRRVPFGKFATDRNISLLAVKRLQPQYRGCVPAAIEYCRQISVHSGKFDTELRLDNDHYYCSEMIELAFRHAGLPLSQPIRIDQLPRIDRLPAPTKILIDTLTTIEMQQEIFVPGNDRIGIWSCPCLDLVIDATPTARPPSDPAMPPGVVRGSDIARSSGPADSVRTAWAGQELRAPDSTDRAPESREAAAGR